MRLDLGDVASFVLIRRSNPLGAFPPHAPEGKEASMVRFVDKIAHTFQYRTMRSMTAAAISLALLASSCSLNSLGTRATESFMTEEDPALVEESLPLLIKAGEILADSKPRDSGLAVTAASLAAMYAAGFVSADAAGIPTEDVDARMEANLRAKRLFLRAFRRCSDALDRREKGVMAALSAGDATPLERFKAKDVPLLYWASASALGAFSLDPFDPAASRNLATAVALLERALELDPDWNYGALQELLVSLAPSLPAALGGGQDRAEEAYARSLKASKGLRASPYVSYASSLCVPRQDYKAFRKALEAALAVDIDADPSGRLANIIAQRNARRLLESAPELFLVLE